MSTRFYITQLTPTLVAAAVNASWNITTGYSIFFLNTYRDRGVSTNYVSGASGSGSPVKMLIVQLVSSVLIAQTINGTLTGQVRMNRAPTGSLTVFGIIYLRKISSSGVITDIGNTTTTALTVGSLVNRSFSLSLSSVAISTGDNLIIEIGCSYTSGANTTVTASANIMGNSLIDLPVDNTSSSGNPWFEFSQTLKFQNESNAF